MPLCVGALRGQRRRAGIQETVARRFRDSEGKASTGPSISPAPLQQTPERESGGPADAVALARRVQDTCDKPPWGGAESAPSGGLAMGLPAFLPRLWRLGTAQTCGGGPAAVPLPQTSQVRGRLPAPQAPGGWGAAR